MPVDQFSPVVSFCTRLNALLCWSQVQFEWQTRMTDESTAKNCFVSVGRAPGRRATRFTLTSTTTSTWVVYRSTCTVWRASLYYVYVTASMAAWHLWGSTDHHVTYSALHSSSRHTPPHSSLPAVTVRLPSCLVRSRLWSNSALLKGSII